MNSSSIQESEAKLEAYTNLVRQYAKTLDLTSPSMLAEFETAVSRSSVYDQAITEGSRVLDIGSGVGLPGIPLAIRRSDLSICLCEIRQRRAAFLERAVSGLKLKNATVEDKDVRKLHRLESPSLEFDVVIAQAVGSLEHLFSLSQHVLAPNWTLVSRKGAIWQDELAELEARTTVSSYETVPVGDGFQLVIVKGFREKMKEKREK
jgi:16S rRNA (guanine527-N7)-methyltransferase